jgi:uncharacterized protein (TIGR00369 family)
MTEKLEWQPLDPDFKQKILNKSKGNLFMQDVGFKFNKIEPGYVETFLIVEQKHLQQMGFIHGGVTATMADITTGFAAFTLVNSNQSVVTVDLKVNYINPGNGHKLIAKGHVYKAGSKLIFCKTEIFIANKTGLIQIAFADSIMAILSDGDIKNNQKNN